ncbi:putative valacyclovir hydrolase [Coniella lustricola]|uniref:Putative valacyclovir hydrolase n=1 Tax=Coniella lustricola TaxID=2025994 RepID=A0A2T3AKB4_9PEZI|nr:putative valacyclovir hydrolase [Coniella lustricola]
MDSHVVALPDGRKLDYALAGAEKGIPLVFLHGTPGSYIANADFKAACARKGIKLITFSRPGYGNSSRQRGRKVVDVVADIVALLEHLGLKETLVAGYSGGGPHALACAARLPGCLAVLSIASPAPFGVEGLDWWEGLGKDNITEFAFALQGEAPLAKFLAAERPGMLSATPTQLVENMSSLLPETDSKVLLNNPSVGEEWVTTLAQALQHDVDGWLDDDLAFVDGDQSWGFALDEIKAPVLLWQGYEDKMVPLGQGKWLAANLPADKVEAHLLEGYGHVSIFYQNLDVMLDGLLVAAGQ